jgi:hypothetical protein
MASDKPTLKTALDALYKAGMQIEFLRLEYHEPGRTQDVLDNISLELQHCCQNLDGEIKALARWPEDRQ